jgi:hypothetical protein
LRAQSATTKYSLPAAPGLLRAADCGPLPLFSPAEPAFFCRDDNDNNKNNNNNNNNNNANNTSTDTNTDTSTNTNTNTNCVVSRGFFLLFLAC